MQPGSQSDIFRHIFPSHLQSRPHKTQTDAGQDGSDAADVDANHGDRVSWTDTEVQDPPADQVDGPSSSAGGGGGGGTQPSDEQPPQSSSSSDGSQTGVDDVPPPKTAPVSDDGGGQASSSTRPRQPGPGRRPVTECRSVPVVYSGETVVRLGEICYQVPRDGS